jgi:hypothetical protein
MPLPIGQVTVFLAIAVPYMLILTVAGMAFSHTWVWLYVLPPGVLAWLVTRPVLEGKRLPELVLSQLRYLAEPRTWCRMTPVAEKDHVMVVVQVWRASVSLESAATFARTAPALASPEPAATSARTAPALAPPEPAAIPESAEDATPGASAQGAPARPAWPDRPAVGSPQRARMASAAAGAVPPGSAAVLPPVATVSRPAATVSAASAPAAVATAIVPAADAMVPAAVPLADPTGSTAGERPAEQPAVTVRSGSAAERPLNVVERALRTSRADVGAGWRERVVVVPGGHRPGKPDHVQRDQARARLLLPGPVRIVVLGSTAGAGQTVTALLTGQLLASLRGEAVAVLDLSAGPGSVTELARQIPRLLPGRQPGAGTDRAALGGAARERALQVVTAEHTGSGPRDADRLIDAVCARYPLTIADPPAADVPRALQAADQLVLVSPASPDGAGSLAMTLEWLEAHGHARLMQASVTVLNGVSGQTAAHAERTAGVAVGRCRAVVRVPWDTRLSGGGALGAETVRAFTALAGVLIAGVAESRPGDVVDAGTPAGPAAGR